MKTKIVFLKSLFDKIKENLRWEGIEKIVWVLCNFSNFKDQVKLIAHTMIPVEKKDYIRQSAQGFEISKKFINKNMNRAIAEQSHLVQVHIHPVGCDTFSAVDKKYERMLMKHIAESVDNFFHASMVFTNDMKKLDAWVYDREIDELVRVEKVVVVGDDELDIYIPTGSQGSSASLSASKKKRKRWFRKSLDRTVRALGNSTVMKLGQLDVGVIGGSALGGPIIEFLARDKVKSISICDMDTISESNLNRLPWATTDDIGVNKAEFYGEVVKKVSPGTKVNVYPRSFYDHDVQAAFSQLDVIFGCVDSGARLSCNRLAEANLIPYFDHGAAIISKNGKKEFHGGQVFKTIPGEGACLNCCGAFEQLQSEFDMPESRDANIQAGYIVGGNKKDLIPLIMPLDYTVAGIGYGLYLKYLSGTENKVPFSIHYDGLKNKIISTEISGDGCIVCSADGYLGKGNKVPIMVPYTKGGAVNVQG
jgi:hypothetical protein